MRSIPKEHQLQIWKKIKHIKDVVCRTAVAKLVVKKMGIVPLTWGNPPRIPDTLVFPTPEEIEAMYQSVAHLKDKHKTKRIL